MPERATGREWPRPTSIDYALFASRMMLTVAVVLLVLQHASGIAWPLLVCGLALLSIAVGSRQREDR